VSSGNQGPCWDAGDMLVWGKAPGRTETSTHWTPSSWKASPCHNTLKEQVGCCPTTGLPDLRPAGLPGRHLLAHCPPTMLPPTCCWHTSHCLTTGGLQNHQRPAPDLPRRCRQIGLDAKGVTPELLRLKFYCSWTGDIFFLFFKCVFVLFTVWLSTISPCWFLLFSFFSLSFSSSFFLLLSWFC
jgi:hypothetical protein